MPEGGELKHDVFGDEKLPTRKLKTYGRQFTLTRQAFINDDIDLVTRIPAKYAASARKTQNKQCYQILVNNPAIYDGTALFSSAHSNLLAKGTGITKEAVQGMILALQNQIDQFGEATIIRPAIIIVPSGYMHAVLQPDNQHVRQHAGSEPALQIQGQHHGSGRSDNQRTLRWFWKCNALVVTWSKGRHRLHRG